MSDFARPFRVSYPDGISSADGAWFPNGMCVLVDNYRGLVDAATAFEHLKLPEGAVIEWADGEPVVEHAIEMSGGGMHIRNDDAEIDRIWPLADWIKSHQRFGGHVWRRTVRVIED